MPTDHKPRAPIGLMLVSLLFAVLPISAFGANNSEFEQSDLNQDQQLSASEFVTAKYSIPEFKSADSDQNQSISITEFAAFKTALRRPQKRPSSGPHPPRG